MSGENNVDKLNIKRDLLELALLKSPFLLAAGVSIEPGSAAGERTAQPLWALMRKAHLQVPRGSPGSPADECETTGSPSYAVSSGDTIIMGLTSGKKKAKRSY